MSLKSELNRLAEAKAKEDYEFEKPIRDSLGAARAVQALIARCKAAKPTDNNNEQPSC